MLQLMGRHTMNHSLVNLSWIGYEVGLSGFEGRLDRQEKVWAFAVAKYKTAGTDVRIDPRQKN